MEWKPMRSRNAKPSWLDRAERLLMPLENKTRNLWLYGAAAVLPFGWVLLLAQAVPVRALARSLRSRFDSFHRA